MTEKKSKEYARWLSKDGQTKLFGADGLEAARADGWKEPTTRRGNGEPWNPTLREGDVPQAESAAEVQKLADQRAAEDAEAEATRIREQQEASEKARAEARANGTASKLESAPDLRVEVVNSDSTAAKSTTAKKSAK